MPELKFCIECSQRKPQTDFSPRGVWAGKVRYRNRCDGCLALPEVAERQPEAEAIRTRRRQLGANYGITPEEYDDLFAAQDGLCAICGEPEKVVQVGTLVRLSIDHCHTTGRVRGLLCHACNRAIGLFGEDVAVMERAATYLERAAAAKV